MSLKLGAAGIGVSWGGALPELMLLLSNAQSEVVLQVAFSANARVTLGVTETVVSLANLAETRVTMATSETILQIA